MRLQGEVSPFNTPLEMHSSARRLSSSMSRSFQYSIGDAALWELAERGFAVEVFQYSIGDAESPASQQLDVAIRRRFQYSIGDAMRA